MAETLLEKVKRYDETRPGIPGEHWLAFAAGVGLWIATRRHPSVAVRVTASLLGTLLVARAATGHDIPPMLGRLPFAGRSPRRHDWIG
jgi:hypothetical protein